MRVDDRCKSKDGTSNRDGYRGGCKGGLTRFVVVAGGGGYIG